MLWQIQIFKLRLYKGIGDSRGGCAKSDKLPHVKSLELASDGFEDYKFNKENSVKLWKKDFYLSTLIAASGKWLKTLLAKLHCG